MTVWRLWRMDDHGNEVVVRDYPTREEADAACAEFHARGHHQHYWVAEVSPPDDAECGSPDSR